ncbi:unnamed protein product [Pleuronectes platessa]|uniref:Uncharacterized protein n=1 Tax=Pleuronectes platessa TaxID=8262 RepID=A0A9N7VLH8_PLEPL|nr:unnamed protein product [Pleuronectes platessa]
MTTGRTRDCQPQRSVEQRDSIITDGLHAAALLLVGWTEKAGGEEPAAAGPGVRPGSSAAADTVLNVSCGSNDELSSSELRAPSSFISLPHLDELRSHRTPPPVSPVLSSPFILTATAPVACQRSAGLADHDKLLNVAGAAARAPARPGTLPPRWVAQKQSRTFSHKFPVNQTEQETERRRTRGGSASPQQEKNNPPAAAADLSWHPSANGTPRRQEKTTHSQIQIKLTKATGRSKEEQKAGGGSDPFWVKEGRKKKVRKKRKWGKLCQLTIHQVLAEMS